MTELSIIIPVYNAEKYIEKCLISIIKNITVDIEKKIEIILINDGSTDKTSEICSQFLKYKYFIYKEQKNSGCSMTRNKGINLAKGKFIWFIDADDYIADNVIGTILKILETKKIDILVFGMAQIRGKKILKKLPKAINHKIESFYDYNILISPVNKIYNKKLLKKYKLFYPVDTHMGEDAAFNFKVFYYAINIKIIQKVFYYQNYGVGVTKDSKKQLEIFNAFKDIYNFYSSKNDFYMYLDILKRFYKIIVIRNSYWVIIKDRNLNFNKINKKLLILYREIKKQRKIFNSIFLLEQVFSLFRGGVVRIFNLDKIKNLQIRGRKLNG